jgi:hypothetical protein
MQHRMTRRQFVPAIGGAAAIGALFSTTATRAQYSPGAGAMYPTTDPAKVKAIVGLSHSNLDGVLELLREDPQLALATWDWGFGDWESALGAASHVGRPAIAEALIEHGARPNLYTFAMLDYVDAVRAICEARPGIQSALGPHGIPLLSHARAGKAARVQEYLEQLGGAAPPSGTIALAEEEQEAYLGTYAYGDGEDAQLLCSRHRNGGIGLTGPSGSFRMIHPKGDHTFTPAGAGRLRVVFDVRDGEAIRVTIHHNAAPLVAERLGA